MPADDCGQIGRADRFLDELEAAGRKRVIAVCLSAEGRDDDDRNVLRREVRLQAVRQLPPIHSGQLNVEDDHRGTAGLEDLERADRVGRLAHFKAGRFEHTASEPEVHGVVVDDEDGCVGWI